VKYFMKDMVGAPASMVVLMRLMPWLWRKLEAAAHTLPYDAAVMTGFRIPRRRLASIAVPALVMNGAKTDPRLRKATTWTETGAAPSSAQRAELARLIDETTRSGIHLASEIMRPSRRGRRYRHSRDGFSVYDGPFIETKELMAGYIIVSAVALEDAGVGRNSTSTPWPPTRWISASWKNSNSSGAARRI
jgi:hypothetical protein